MAGLRQRLQDGKQIRRALSVTRPKWAIESLDSMAPWPRVHRAPSTRTSDAKHDCPDGRPRLLNHCQEMVHGKMTTQREIGLAFAMLPPKRCRSVYTFAPSIESCR
jgi:hypothetical protein